MDSQKYNSEHKYLYKAHITRVVDGDTFHADVELGFDVSIKEVFRLYGIDTPETYRPRNELEREHGKQATDAVKAWMEGDNVVIQTYKDRGGKYGRMLADVWHEGHGEWLSEMLTRRDLIKRDEYVVDTDSLL